MPPKDTAREVKRLSDIIVDEVSLVDNAANKHRFLIVKRSDLMDEVDSSKTAPGQEPNVGADPVATSEDDTPSGGGTGGARDTAGSCPLSAAVSALESLTGAVEQVALSPLGEKSKRAQVLMKRRV